MTIASERPRSGPLGTLILRLLVVACLAAAAWGAWLQPARVDVGSIALADRILHPLVTNEHLQGFRQAQSVAVSSDGRVAMAIMHGADGRDNADMKIYRSEDGGARWVRLQVPAGVMPHRIALSADGRRALVLGTRGEILRTADGGATWAAHDTGITVPPSIAPALHFVTMSADGMRGFVRARLANNREFLLRTDDGGATWSRQPADIGAFAMAADGQHALMWSARPGMISRTTDGGRTWTSHAVPGSGLIRELALSADGRAGLAVGTDDAWSSNDGGETWSPGAGHLGNPIYLALSPIHDGRRIVGLSHGAGDQRLHVSQDGGRTWATASIKRQQFDSYWNVALSADGLRGVMIGQAQAPILRTTDGGATWQPFASPGPSIPYWVYGAAALGLGLIVAQLLAARRRVAA